MLRPEIERLSRQVDVFWPGANKKTLIQRLMAWQVCERKARLSAAGKTTAHLKIPNVPGPDVRPFTKPSPNFSSGSGGAGQGSALTGA
jgi:hypothetical protein